MLIALSPAIIAGTGWEAYCESFFEQLNGLESTHLPELRRRQNRCNSEPRLITTQLLEQIEALM